MIVVSSYQTSAFIVHPYPIYSVVNSFHLPHVLVVQPLCVTYVFQVDPAFLARLIDCSDEAGCDGGKIVVVRRDLFLDTLTRYDSVSNLITNLL